MLGAVIGDIIGSPYDNRKFIDPDFPLISEESKYTEISIMTLAVAEALIHAMPTQGIVCEGGKFQGELIFWMKRFGRKFSRVRYGRKFYAWIHTRNSFPYESFSNGAALRVSPVAFAFDNILDVERFAELTARVTTTTDESIKLARGLAGMIFLARMKKDKFEIKKYFQERAEINFSVTLKDFEAKFNFLSIEGKRPTSSEIILAALESFIETENFEESVRTAISLGGKACEAASISGALAQAYSGVRVLTEVEAFEKLHRRLQFTVEKWEQWKNN